MMPMESTSNATVAVTRFTEVLDYYLSKENQENSFTLDVKQINGDITMHDSPTYRTFRRSEDIQLVTVNKKR
jgi:hypothetical protein